MKLSTRFTSIRRNIFGGFIVVVAILCFAWVGTGLIERAQARGKSVLNESDLDFFAQNNIFYYDPSCIATGNSTICGDTAKEKYWSALSKYFDDPIQIAGIIGNIHQEGNFNPVSWQCGNGINSSGNFVNSGGWGYYYNLDGTVGVGSFGITSGLNRYLHYINDNAPELIQYFSNPKEYSFNWCYHESGYDFDESMHTYGDELLEKIGAAEFDKLVEWEVKYAIEEFNTGRTESYKSKKFSTPKEASNWWAEFWEICGGTTGDECLRPYESSPAKQERARYAEKTYDELENFNCVGGGGSSGRTSISDVADTDITLIGDSLSVYAEKELEEKFPSASNYLNMVGSRSIAGGAKCSDPGGLSVLRSIVSGNGLIPKQLNNGDCVMQDVDNSSLKNTVVWELGGNTGGAWPLSSGRKNLEEVWELVGSNRKLILVTPYNGIETLYGETGFTTKEVTDKIAELYREFAEEHDNVYIADWNEAVRHDESRYIEKESYAYVHPKNEEARKLLADLIAEAVEGAQECTIDVSSSSYQERIKNLHRFNQASGTWARSTMCIGRYDSGASRKEIHNHGCGVMSYYAVYYMFTGNNLDDEAFFTDLRNAMYNDHYIGSACGGTSGQKEMPNMEDLTGMKAEEIWGCDVNDCYKDEYWDTIVDELRKGNKILLGTAGSSAPERDEATGRYLGKGQSIFAQGYHASFLDHYDESTGMVYRFDPIYERCNYSGIECNTENSKNGHYVTREAMEEYVRPYSAWRVMYGDSSCYNICAPTGGNETKPIYPLDENSDGIACAQGTEDLGVYDAHYFGKEIKARLCALPNLPSDGRESTPGDKYYIDGAEGRAVVNSRVSGAFYALVERAKSDGINLSAASSFRTYGHQADLWVENGCSASGCTGTTTAPAGSSNHEGGYAIDFNGTCEFGTGPDACDARGNVVSLWLRDNIGDFGFVRTVSTEAWHVDAPSEPLDGGN